MDYSKLYSISILISLLTVSSLMELQSRNQGLQLNDCPKGRICEPKCPTTCVRVLCNKTSSVCSEGCVNGFYGDICNVKCAANCKDLRCLRGTGRCIKCATGWYGPHCELKCSYCTAGASCDQETGDCNDTKISGWRLGVISVCLVGIAITIIATCVYYCKKKQQDTELV